jgi:hypothetical protein
VLSPCVHLLAEGVPVGSSWLGELFSITQLDMWGILLGLPMLTFTMYGCGLIGLAAVLAPIALFVHITEWKVAERLFDRVEERITDNYVTRVVGGSLSLWLCGALVFLIFFSGEPNF